MPNIEPSHRAMTEKDPPTRLRLVEPAHGEEDQVGLAPPDGRGALAAKPEEKLAAYL